MDYTFLRAIPQHLHDGYSSGSLYVNGSTVKHVSNHQIAGHLIPGTESALQQAGAIGQGLLSATMALQGANLALSAIGFMVVCKKLNTLQKSVDALSEQIDGIRAENAEYRQLQDLRKQGTIHAALQSLADALHTQSESQIGTARHLLTEYSGANKPVVEWLTQDVQRLYADHSRIEYSKLLIQQRAAIELTLARSRMLLGDTNPREFDIAQLRIDEFRAWHTKIRDHMEFPRRQPQLWTHRPTNHITTIDQLLRHQTDIENGISASDQLLTLCRDEHISYAQIVEESQHTGILYLERTA